MKNKKSKLVLACGILLHLFCLLALTGCFSDWQGDEGTITISFGGGGNGRTALPSPKSDDDPIHKYIEYRISLTRNGEPFGETLITTDKSKTISVPVGIYDVKVDAYLKKAENDRDYYFLAEWFRENSAWSIISDSIRYKDIFYAVGKTESVNVIAGQPANAKVEMKMICHFTVDCGKAPCGECGCGCDGGDTECNCGNGDACGCKDDCNCKDCDCCGGSDTGCDCGEKCNCVDCCSKDDTYKNEFNICCAEKWNMVIGIAKNDTRDKQKYTLNIKKTFDIEGYAYTVPTFGNNNYEIEINGNNKNINLSWSGALLLVGKDQKVTINDLGLQGIDNNGSPLVMIDGTLTMKGESSICNNVLTAGQSGSGVRVYDGGTFNMEGGEISGNIAIGNGGGVRVYDGGEFNMSGGIISNNTAGENGGGVFNGGTFTMEGGEISGNIALGNGGGVSVEDNCTFRIVNGTIYGNEDGKEENLNNTARSGAALYVAIYPTGVLSGIAEYGIFVENEWKGKEIPTNLGGRDKTIKVVNGELENEPDFRVNDQNSWSYALNSISNIIKSDWIIEIVDNIILGSDSTFSDSDHNDIHVTIRGNYTITSRHSTSLLFGASSSNQTFILQDVELVGYSNNYYPLVSIGDKGKLEMHGNSSISGNTSSSGNGGGVYVASGSTFKMYDYSSVSGNKANKGGGVYVADGGTFEMFGNSSVLENETIENDDDNDRGGGVYVNGENSTFNMNNGTISGNTSNGGGGVYAQYGTFNMIGGTISSNTAIGSGGGVFIAGNVSENKRGSFTMKGGTISSNTTENDGGGVYVMISDFIMDGGEISGNHSYASDSMSGGGGVCVGPAGDFIMNGGNISGNTATDGGGGVFVFGNSSTNIGTFTMNAGTISSNIAKTGGGVSIGIPQSTYSIFKMTNGTIYGNNANDLLKNTATTGDALYVADGSTAQYGNDTNGWTDFDNVINTTIEVINGVKQP